MKSKKDIVESPSGLTAVNAFIFAGSFSIGVMKAGFDLKRVLEISNTQLVENAFYFKKNVEDVPVILPNEWENDQYLDKLKDEHIDLMCCNCPCSSLSQINRNASIDGKNNVHFYRLFNIFKHAKPKVFIIENAPTLIKLGYQILKDMVNGLSCLYKFTVVRDIAGNHEVPMTRQRTLVFGWRNDAFKGIPVVKQDIHPMMTVDDALANAKSNVDDYESRTCNDIKHLYRYAIPGFSLMTSLAKKSLLNEDNVNEQIKSTKHFNEVMRIAKKISDKKNYWDKSPYKLIGDKRFPSFTSVTEYLHPSQDRMLNIKEMQQIMNYPDWYDFTDPNKECKIPVAQAMAQGVPVNFGKYAAMQARNALEGKLNTISDDSVVLSFQHHSKHKISTFTLDEVNSISSLETKSDSNTLKG